MNQRLSRSNGQENLLGHSKKNEAVFLTHNRFLSHRPDANYLQPYRLVASSIDWLIVGILVWIILLYVVRMLATTSIYHLLLIHKSYQAPAVLWVGCIVVAAAGQMGLSWWKAHHVAHHQHVDQNLDPHSPYTPIQGIGGFYWSQGGWLLSPRFFPAKLPMDVENDAIGSNLYSSKYII